MINNQRAEENMLNTVAAAAAECGEQVKKMDNDDGRRTSSPDLHRCVTSGSCDQANKNQAAPPPPSTDTTSDIIAMDPHHRQALAHLYHSSRRSRNFRSVPSSPSAITYAQGEKKLIHQDELKKDVSILQVTSVPEEPSTKAVDVEWSFDIASLVDDDCSSVSSFDGEESFMDNDIFRIQSDCWKMNDTKNSISGPMSSDGLHTSVDGRSCKRLRTT